MDNALATAGRSPGRLAGHSGRAQNRRWIEGGLIIVFWGVIALLTIAQHALDPRFGDQGGLRPGEALQTLLEYIVWAIVTPGIFWLSHRFRLERGNLLRNLLLHVFVAVMVAVAIDLFGHAMSNALTEGHRRPVTLAFSLLAIHFLDEFLLYLIVLAVGLARDNFLRYREHQEEVTRLQAENLRKTREMEQARRLQLSMLPGTIPSLPGLDLAAYMQTATEVGGDYYDFHTADDGTLTIAIGDATGHGLQAGVMVAITKGLFKLMAGEPDLLEIIGKATQVIKNMNLPQLYMAMTLARFQSNRLQLIAAGMPMPLIYRSADHCVEEVEIKGMPLGSFVHFPYQQKEVQIQEGDTVLLMSDGFPELFNDDGEMMGYSKAKVVFKKVAESAPSEIIQQFAQEVASWSDGPPNDDITFVVINVKPVRTSVNVTEAESSASTEDESVMEPRGLLHTR